MVGNPYDGHTLNEALEQAEIRSEMKPEQVFVDRGHQGVKIAGIRIWKSCQKRGITRALPSMKQETSPLLRRKHSPEEHSPFSSGESDHLACQRAQTS
jgi:IS5 family transposase